MAKKTIINY